MRPRLSGYAGPHWVVGCWWPRGGACSAPTKELWSLDGYRVYKNLAHGYDRAPGYGLAHRWAHVLRKFRDTEPSDFRSLWMLERIGELYAVAYGLSHWQGLTRFLGELACAIWPITGRNGR